MAGTHNAQNKPGVADTPTEPCGKHSEHVMSHHELHNHFLLERFDDGIAQLCGTHITVVQQLSLPRANVTPY